MSELLKAVLTDKTARNASARRVAAVRATEALQPWQ